MLARVHSELDVTDLFCNQNTDPRAVCTDHFDRGSRKLCCRLKGYICCRTRGRLRPIMRCPCPSPPTAVEECVTKFCALMPGCNAAVYCGREGGCGGNRTAAGSRIGDCTLLAVNNTMAPAQPADAGSGFKSAVVLGPPLPPYCAGLPRRACEVCVASKNPAGCADCTRRAANEPFDRYPWELTGSAGVWHQVGSTPLPVNIPTYIGCARCFSESASPGVCAECLRPGPRNSSCFGCVMAGWDAGGLRYQNFRPDPGLNKFQADIDACVTCTLKFGRMWEEAC